MQKRYGLVLFAIFSLSLLEAVAGQPFGGSQAFYNGPLGFIDSLTVTQINDPQDFLMFVVAPLIGVYGLMWFIFSKILQVAENNFAGNNNPMDDDLTDMGAKAAMLMAAAVAVITVMRFGQFNPAIALILLILGLAMLLRNAFGMFGGPGGGGTTTVNTPTITPNVNTPTITPNVNTPSPGTPGSPSPGTPGSPSPGTPGTPGGGPGGSNNNTNNNTVSGGNQSTDIDLTDLIDLDMDLDSSSMQHLAAMMQQQQQQQQQQMQMSPAMMQFMALLHGNIAPGNGGGVMINAPNANNVTVNQQQISQLIQMMVQVINEGDDDFDQQFIFQIMQIMGGYDGDLDVTIIQKLEKMIQKIENNPKIVQINNYEIEQVVNQQYYDIANIIMNRFQQVIKRRDVNINQKAYIQFINLLELNMTADSGDTVIIHVDNGQDVEIEVSVVVQLISVIERFPSSLIGVLVDKLVEVFINIEGPITQEILVEITNIMINIEDGGEVSQSHVDITIEGVELVTSKGLQPVGRIRRDNGSYIYIVPEGTKPEELAIHARVACNEKNGLQKISFNFDNRQSDIGLNTTNYGHEDDEVVSLTDIAGNFNLKKGQIHNFGIDVIGQRGGTETAVRQLLVGDIEGKVPELPPGKKDNIPALPPGKQPEQPPALEPGDQTPELGPGPDRPPLPEGESELLKEIEDIIGKLDGDLEIGDVLREKRDARNKLLEALKQLVDNENILRALIYFREVDFSAPHADVHQQVEKILNNLRSNNNNDGQKQIKNASQLQKEIKNVQQIFGKVEKALRELEEAYENLEGDFQGQKRSQSEIQDIANKVDQISDGRRNLEKYLEEYYN